MEYKTLGTIIFEMTGVIPVTSNLGLEDIEQRLETCGGAIVSRIIEMCRGVKIMGADYRKEKIK